MHRPATLLTLATIVSAMSVDACADRLINVPTGTKVHLGKVRFESLFNQGRAGARRDSIAMGVSQLFDLEIVHDSLGARRGGETFDLGYNIAFPVVDTSPGISFGFRDALNKTVDGRGVYAAMTFKYGQLDTFNADSPAEVTIGVGAGAFRGAFLGFLLPVTNQFRLIGEHDSRRFTAGVEVRPSRDVAIRWVHRQDAALLSVGWTVRF